MCLICVEISDVVFALDSIPACLAISHDSIIGNGCSVSVRGVSTLVHLVLVLLLLLLL